MTSLAIMRAAGLLVTGVVGCEFVRRYDPPSIPTPTMPIVINSTPASRNYTQYAPFAIAGAGFVYFFGSQTYVTSQQFQKTYQALQTQVSTVSTVLGKVKTKVLEKFGIVEARLDDIERTVLLKTADIKRDVATVETMLAQMSGKVDKIDVQTRQCAEGVGLLCSVVADNLNNTLHNKSTAVHNLNIQAKQILNL